MINENDITIGDILKILMENHSITKEDILKDTLISEQEFLAVLDDNNLMPLSLAIFFKNKLDISIELWGPINDVLADNFGIKYIGSDIGYQMLFNKIMFEKD